MWKKQEIEDLFAEKMSSVCQEKVTSNILSFITLYLSLANISVKTNKKLQHAVENMGIIL